MSEDTANPADVAEQQQDVVPTPRDDEDAYAAHELVLPDDANEADVLEQSLEVGDDDEDDRE